MNYIIYDLEFNQKNYISAEIINNTIETEINRLLCLLKSSKLEH